MRQKFLLNLHLLRNYQTALTLPLFGSLRQCPSPRGKLLRHIQSLHGRQECLRSGRMRVADAAAIAPADVGFKPVRSPLAKDGELTHAVAGNSKNLAGMAKNARVAASGKQGGMKGGYL